MTSLCSILETQEKLEKAATAGPWIDDYSEIFVSDTNGSWDTVVGKIKSADSEFIVHFRNHAAQVREGVSALVEALRDIARQPTVEEAENDPDREDGELGDMECGYETMIQVARATLERLGFDKEGE